MNELRVFGQSPLGQPPLAKPSPAPFNELEIAELNKGSIRTISFRDGENLISAGSVISHSYLLTDGWVGRVYTALDGRQQVVNTYLPGDIYIVRHGQPRRAALDAVALTDGEAIAIDPKAMADAAQRLPELQDKLNWHTMRVMNIVSNQVVSLSLRASAKRILFQLLEIRLRLDQVHQLEDGGYDLPLSQTELGQICGLSVVAVNRAMRRLRDQGLISGTGRRIGFPNLTAAMAFAEFDPGYLEPFASPVAAAQ